MRRRFLPCAGLLLAAAIALTGCTPPAAEPTAWQSTVQTVANQASAGDYASALATLDALEAEVVSRRDAGTLSTGEAEAILGRIAAVRADLTSLTPTPTPTSTPTAEPAPDEQPTISDDDGADDEQPADPGQQGPGGNDKGKGPGKDDKGPGSGGPGKKDG
ncbi:hypothetical protein NS220_02625 [Microbacterium testaceum]|uniref:Uncharacterized protein n=1 Tax=Microbacterium testaceum TaxID=2033 RepID=A0A147F0L4_MICTE|nr:hypothetical protein [Microbacterium testaceum]KTR96336.1 hypothetical protein NS220_02625 [Microbacterium testaceum]